MDKECKMKNFNNKNQEAILCEKELQITSLQKEKEQLLKMLDTLPVSVCLVTQDYRITYYNKAFCDKFGELKGRLCHEARFGLKAPCDFCESHKPFKTGKPHFWSCRGPDGKFNIDFYTFLFIDLSGSPLVLVMDVDITLKQKIFDDIKKQADTISFLNKRLKDQYEELETIYTFAPVGLCVLDENCRYLKVNKVFAKFNKISASEHIGKTVRDIAPGLAEKAEALNRRVLSTNKPILGIEVSGEVPAEPGRKRYWLESWYPVKNRKITIVVAEDITTKKEAEKARLKSFQNKILTLERKKIARELHDTVSQALFSSNLFSESISKTWKTDPIRSLNTLDIVRNLNRSALNDIRTLVLELMPEKKRKEDLAVLLKELLASVGNKFPNIKTEIEINGKSELPDMVKHEIYRIAQEAVNNTIKHANTALLKVVLKSNDEELKLVISDNGRGFDVDFEERDPRSFGLNIMYERARLIGASINIESSPGKGSTISLVYSKPVDIK